MAAAEAWDEASVTGEASASVSGAACLSAMPLQLLWVWQLLSPWQWASASVCPRRSPRLKYRPDPNHTRYLVDPDPRTELKRCGQRSYSTHRGLP